MNVNWVSPCNIYCGNCAVHKKGKCSGCAEESRNAQAEGKVFCDIYLCAKEKNYVMCSDCKCYPCERYDKAIFAESFIKWIREKLQE